MIWLVGFLFAVGLVALTPACWRAGRGLVPRWRRLLVAAALAAGITVPALPTLVLGFSLFNGVAERVIVPEDAEVEGHAADRDRETWERVVEQPTGSPDLIVILLLWVSLLKTASQSLRLPRRLGHLQQLPPVSDAAMVARTTELV